MEDPANIERKLVQLELLKLTNELRELRGEPPAQALPEAPFCSFCGRGKNEVGGMIEGISGHICDACAAEASRIFRTREAPLSGKS
ncbi:MAG: ClpX C4-type zinc finger protein [Rhodocyclaceae bacterium]|nr:ClpX C4-type zinc finger protein [Rhodocyclaceae bacterium]MCA3394137.1 ClpX C4-type zinc finger protein [Roseomonas sp.]MCA6468335.1 ClpX C4-type zinc finger protein [Chitinophagaceae bacterium]MCA3039205.1 ClpX C4-type zinc finger protein [Rhodocyclaceae bacterium]MCA3050580.1 ClpX C4-type zinc finger protein [Rhodocyclaceae bacterium]